MASTGKRDNLSKDIIFDLAKAVQTSVTEH